MKRRAFLGFLGGAAAAGPSAVKAAGEMTMADTALGHSSLSGAATRSGWSLVGKGGPADRKGLAKGWLDELLGKSAAQIAREKRDYHLSSLDPDTASLRSMSLAAKIRRDKARGYETQRAREEERYRGIIAGLWE